MSTLSNLKNVSSADRRMIQGIETMMGPEPSQMGFIKNLFWSRFRSDLVFPYPTESRAEREKCDRLIKELGDYLENEHPRIQIDQEEFIPEWVIQRLFEMGVMGMTIPEKYGGLGLGVTSYNRVLDLIGRYCGSTAVVVSAHQSIGCKAIMLFGTEEQKETYLPRVARDYLSAFCLSEPNVGSDAAGQDTTCELTEDGEFFIVNGEKKWSTSGSMAGLYTVMAKQRLVDPQTGKTKEAVTALLCTPDMEGIEVFQKNRSKTGIRGTWQARIRFTDVRVPRKNVLHEEGKGLQVALSCLNYGRCTLSAGVTGGARQAMDQAVKWVQTRHQFDRALADFELVQMRIARMAAYVYAMDAMLYMMTGMLDRHDADIMVETAITKVFCSEYGWRVIDDAMQLMGGEGYVTENELDRIWRDNRIHRIVEGSNEVMQSFIFAYGGKQVAEQMISIQEGLLWDGAESASENLRRIAANATNPRVLARAIPLAAQLFAGFRPPAPDLTGVDARLEEYANRLSRLVSRHAHYFKLTSKWHREEIVAHQAAQARVADNAVILFALAASLSKMDEQLRSGQADLDRDVAVFDHLFDLLSLEFDQNIRAMRANADDSMREAAAEVRKHNDTLPDSNFYIHEASPTHQGAGRVPQTNHIRQFPGGSGGVGGDGATGEARAKVATKRQAAKNK